MKELDTFMCHIREFAEELRQNAENHGCGDYTDERYLVLMHTEISEAVEAFRDGNPESEKIPGFTLVVEEMADLVIRALHFSAMHGLDIAGAIIAKAEYNKGRPFKHGREW